MNIWLNPLDLIVPSVTLRLARSYIRCVHITCSLMHIVRWFGNPDIFGRSLGEQTLSDFVCDYHGTRNKWSKIWYLIGPLFRAAARRPFTTATDGPTARGAAQWQPRSPTAPPTPPIPPALPASPADSRISCSGNGYCGGCGFRSGGFGTSEKLTEEEAKWVHRATFSSFLVTIQWYSLFSWNHSQHRLPSPYTTTLYRVLLTLKQRLCFNIRSIYSSVTFVLMSTKPKEQPECSTCT